jgi:hypothetical protein
MRSQKRTYAIDAAKNAIVTEIHKTSCMGYLLEPISRTASLISNGFPRAAACGCSPFQLSIYFYELATAPRRIELRDVDSHRP